MCFEAFDDHRPAPGEEEFFDGDDHDFPEGFEEFNEFQEEFYSGFDSSEIPPDSFLNPESFSPPPSNIQHDEPQGFFRGVANLLANLLSIFAR